MKLEYELKEARIVDLAARQLAQKMVPEIVKLATALSSTLIDGAEKE